MFNAFWIKADVLNAGQNVFTNDDKTFNFYLTDIVEPETNYGATGTGAFRCSLAILIAFSSVLGRAGPLEAWIISFFGSFGY